MAAVDKWRTRLNERSFCKKLRENNVKESNKKSKTESKCIIAVNDNDLFVWDNTSSHILFYNLQNLADLPAEKQNRAQVLYCTDSPKFDVDWLVWNLTKTHLALWGQLGITVVELPQKWGKFAEFQGGKDSVSCKCVSVGEHYFSSHVGVRLLQLAWHPASSADTHIVFLTSDNIISIYDIMEPERPSQTLYLGDSEPSFSLSVTRPSTSLALGDNVVGFDFGPGVDVQKKSSSLRAGKGASLQVWPLYCVRGNGDVIVAFSDLSPRPAKLPVQGPLLMSPPAEDNYGTDACAILCLPTTPPVIAIATCDGRLHHCILLARDMEETTLQSENSYRSLAEESCIYDPPEEKLLYVTETVELELSLATPQLEGGEDADDIFTCPVRLTKDVSTPDRYHCCHAAGVHTVALPWIHSYTSFCLGEEEEEMLPVDQQSIVEHLICTKPLLNSPPSPVLGLAQVKDTSIGTILLTLSSDYEFHCLRLSDTRYGTGDVSVLSSRRGRSIPSPLRKISKEPFDDRIRKILQRNTSNPLLKSRSNTEQSQQECFQLLSRATQVFREEYIQKQDLARQEIKRRVSILKDQKAQQMYDLGHLQESRNILSENAEKLAETCEDCKEKQTDIMDRLETVMRKLQARIPFLSESERAMKRDLETIDDRLETYRNSLDQIRVKRDYQHRQIQQTKKTSQPSPILKKNQMTQLRDVLKQEGDEVADLLKKLNQLTVDASV